MFCNNLFQKEWNDDSVSFPILHAMLWLVLCDSHYSWVSVNSHLLTPDRELVILPQIVPKFNLVSQCVSFGSLVEIWAVYRSRDDSRTSHQRPAWAAAPESWDSGVTALLAAQQVGGCHFQRVWMVWFPSRQLGWSLLLPDSRKRLECSLPLIHRKKSSWYH